MSALKFDELPHYTYQEYVEWEGCWELIDGIPYAMSPAPMKKHQALANRIGQLLGEALEACYASQPVDWKISDDTVVQPDNLIICEDPEGLYITKAPPLVVEILSPGTARKDEGVKFRLYESEGVIWYLIVNPEESLVKVYENIEGRFVKRLDATDEAFAFSRLPCEVSINFSRLWG